MASVQRPETADEIADRATLDALLICWSREITGPSPTVWRFPTRQGWLDMMPSRTLHTGMPPRGALTLDGHAIGCAAALDLLTDRLADDHPATGPQLVRRIRQSRDRIAAIVAARSIEPEDGLDFLAGEQAVIFGHWMHPAPKALEGMNAKEERAMTPDHRGTLRLHGLDVAPDLIERGGVAAELPEMEGLIPAHPLTLDRLRRQPHIAALFDRGAIRDLGPMGPAWHATSSVRTLWSPDSPWMVKVSLPVTVTNSQRVNKRHELRAGRFMSDHMATFGDRFGPIRFITDPAWVTLRLPDRSESGFEVVLRENPYRDPRGGRVVQIAGLTAPGLPGRPGLLARAVRGHDPARWFAAYLDVALDPLLRLYDATGIAFEAHQQNVLLDLADGLPKRADLRDNQGFYIAETHATQAMRAIPALVYPQAEAEAALAYTLLVNQIFGVIHRMDVDGLLPEHDTLTLLAERLVVLSRTLTGNGGRLAARWLHAPDLPAKGNMLTQLGGVDELDIPGERAPFIQVPNPLRTLTKALRDVA